MARAKKKSTKPSDVLRIAVTFKRPSDGLGLTEAPARLTGAAVRSYTPDPQDVAVAIAELSKLGFTVTRTGKMSVSVRGTRENFERVFGVKLVERKLKPADGIPSAESFFAPAGDSPWNETHPLAGIIDDAYVQWPHIYMADRFPPGEPSPVPPRIDYHHLRVPGDVCMVLNAAKVHRQGGTGKGVRVVMIDSGFAHGHPYFTENGYNTSVVLAPGATDPDKDGNGHGTGESANLLAIAPDVTFVGVKLDNENDPGAGASVLEGFQEALRHNPKVISVSLGYDLANPDRTHLTQLPNSLKALEAEIQAAVADGVVVVFSAGNGHVAFPGMMPGVVSAGGVYVDEKGAMLASDYASGFQSKIYPGRNVPDFCGLVGMQPHADYIMLPIQSGCQIDNSNATHDKTGKKDGWGVFSGTSAAAPQLAGVCALLLQKNPGLSPTEVKAILGRTCRDVTDGKANAMSNEGTAARAGTGEDVATGSGLVDAFAAWQQA
ncbi:MAG TPA: S8 family serine peptidase [Gemmataceae bacterium]|nr:S8 family serine peptidase [Gemmataceae bacterium]